MYCSESVQHVYHHIDEDTVRHNYRVYHYLSSSHFAIEYDLFHL